MWKIRKRSNNIPPFFRTISRARGKSERKVNDSFFYDFALNVCLSEENCRKNAKLTKKLIRMRENPSAGTWEYSNIYGKSCCLLEWRTVEKLEECVFRWVEKSYGTFLFALRLDPQIWVFMRVSYVVQMLRCLTRRFTRTRRDQILILTTIYVCSWKICKQAFLDVWNEYLDSVCQFTSEICNKMTILLVCCLLSMQQNKFQFLFRNAHNIKINYTFVNVNDKLAIIQP